ncbi:hypothetical protein ACHAXT_000821 [Thalassiosira profunda]
MSSGDSGANAPRIQLGLFLVELALAVVMAASAYLLLNLLPFTGSLASGLFSTVAGLWIVKSTVWALQSLKNRSVGEDKEVGSELCTDDENDALKAYDQLQKARTPESEPRQRRVQFAGDGGSTDDMGIPPPSQKLADTKMFLTDTAVANQYTSKISFPLLAILSAVLLQCAVRLLIIVQNVRRSWRRCSAKRSGLIQFADIPFTLGRGMSASGCSFHIFSFLNGWLECDGGDAVSDSEGENEMVLQAVAFDRMSINSSHIIVNPPRKHPAARGQLSWLGIEFEDIDMSLTILLKRKGRRLDDTPETFTRSITIRLAVKNVEFGLFRARLDWFKATGVNLDAQASFEDGSVSSSDDTQGFAGAGLSVALSQLNMHRFAGLAAPEGQEDIAESKIMSWGNIESSLRLQRPRTWRKMASWLAIPSGVALVDSSETMPKRARVTVGDVPGENRLAVGVNLRDTHSFVALGELLLRNVASCLVRCSTAMAHASTTSKQAREKRPVEVVEVNAAISTHLYSHDTVSSFSLGMPHSVLRWEKSSKSDSSCPLLMADIPVAGFQCIPLSAKSATAALDLVRLKGIRATFTESKGADIDLGEVTARFSGEDMVGLAGVARTLESLKLAAANLQRIEKEAKQGDSQPFIRETDTTTDVDAKQQSLQKIEVACKSVDAIFELPGGSSASERVRMALLHGPMSVAIAKQQGIVDERPDTLDCDILLPNAFFRRETQRCGQHYLVKATVARGEGSVTVFPHSSLPVLDEPASSEVQETALCAKISQLTFDTAVPLEKMRPVVLSKAMRASFGEIEVYERFQNQATEGAALFSIPAHDFAFRPDSSDASHRGWPMAQTYARSPAAGLAKIAHCKGSFCLIEKRNDATGERVECISVQFGKSPTELEFVWTPMLQWIQVSLNNRIQSAQANLKALASAKPLRKRKVVSHKMNVRVEIDPNAAANLRMFVGVKSMMHAIFQGGASMKVSIAKYLPPSRTTLKQLNKPNVYFRGKRVKLHFNDIAAPIFSFEGASFNNYLRKASEDEISEYLSFKTNALDEFGDEIVVDQDGHPLKEIFELNLGKSATANFPPALLFGEVTDDFVLLPKALDAGLNRLKGLSAGHKKPKRYQLMSIKCTIPFLDATLMGKNPDADTPITPKRNMYRDELRIAFEGAEISIERNTPPEWTQATINALDEDDSSTYVYGPAIQGGLMSATVQHLMVTLHPLNLATPLTRIDDFALSGYLFMVGLSPTTPGIQEGKTVTSKLLCHHSHSSCVAEPSCSQRQCCCGYGVSMHSAGIPVKVYADGRVTCRVLDVSYGPCMNRSVPRLMECIERILPPKSPGQVPTAPLAWWDNTRFFIHGSISLSADELSVRWLLDSHISRDLSILLCCDNFVLVHTARSFALDASEVQVSIPGVAYDMSVHPSERETRPAFHLPHEAESMAGKARHPLIYVPKLKAGMQFSWEMLQPGRASSGHHSVYMTRDSTASFDKFAPFRSDGWDVEFDFDLVGSDVCDCWGAVRLDVLPWFTHLNPTVNYAASMDEHKPDPLPKFRSVAIRASATKLRLATWFEDEEDLDGLCLIVRRLEYTSTVEGKKDVVVEGPVKAALLDVSELKHAESEESQRDELMDVEQAAAGFGAARTLDTLEADGDSSQSSDGQVGLSPFLKLQRLSDTIDELDFVVVTGQIDVRNKALARILATEDAAKRKSLERKDSATTYKGLDRTTWSILVARLRLLYTIEIRDGLTAISKDLIFVIGFMKSQHRVMQALSGTTPQQDHLGETYDLPSPLKRTLAQPNDDRALHHSMLEYLLDPDLASSRSIFSSASLAEHTQTKTLPTFDVILSNPQVQMRGGGDGALILAMEQAHIEGRKFIHFLVTNSRCRTGQISPADLLRKTEHMYSLTNMAAYSVSTRVDVNIGLPWLEVGTPDLRPLSPAIALEERFGINGSPDNNGHSSMQGSATEEKGSQRSNDEQGGNSSPRQHRYPAKLRHHEPMPFAKSGLLRPILDKFTFQSRQLFHRPPIHYSKEELHNFIEQGLITSEDEAPVDIIQLQIDALDFNLDSYQFKTTIDVIRNVLLEAPKPHSRNHQTFLDDDATTEVQQTSEHTNISSLAAVKMEDVLRNESKLRGKKRRHALHTAAMNLMRDLEDQRMTLDGNDIFRRVSYELSQLRWCIQSDEEIDDVQIAFTGFSGQHDYAKDGSIVSQLSLEDVHVSSSLPGPDSMNFADPTSVVAAKLFNDRSPCQRCGQYFDHSDNRLDSCPFHTGQFKSGRWTCCESTITTAQGCKSGPHSGKEHAAVVRVETLPRVVEGLSLYSHFEVNVFPGVLHTLVVQVSKSMSRLFMSYFFIGDEDDDDLATVSTTRTDATAFSSDSTSIHSESPPNSTVRKKSLLIGKRRGMSEDSPRGYSDFGNPSEQLNAPKEETKEAEVAFIKVWRVGDVDVNVSLGGFKRFPAYSKAYEVGTWEHLGRKYLTYLVREVLKSGASSAGAKFKRKMMGSSAVHSPGHTSNQLQSNALEQSSSPRSSLVPSMPSISDAGPVDLHNLIGRHLRKPMGAADILGTPAKKALKKKRKASKSK